MASEASRGEGAAAEGQAPAAAAWFWGLVAAGVALDQITKLIAFAALDVGQHATVIPGVFHIVPRLNPGMAFSLGRSIGQAAPALLAAVNVVVVGVVVRYRHRTVVTEGRRVFDLALGLILSGAAGNIIDRFRPPHFVRDFLDFGIGRLRWPTFNLADAYIVVGVFVYIYWAWRTKPRAAPPP